MMVKKHTQGSFLVKLNIQTQFTKFPGVGLMYQE